MTAITGSSASGPCVAMAEVIQRCPAWAARYDNGGQDVPAAAAMSPQGDALFLILFSADASGGLETATVALDPATGQQRWVAREGGNGRPNPGNYDLAVSPDGTRVYAIGTLDWNTGCNPNPCDDAFVAAYDARTGDSLWKEVVDGPLGGWDYLSAITTSPDGTRIFVAGASQGVDNDQRFPGAYDNATLDALTMALDASDGATLWSARYDRVAGHYDAASSIEVSPDGERVFVGGNTAGVQASDGDSDYLTLAYDSGLSSGDKLGGRLLWAARLDSDVPKDLVLPWDVANDLALAPDGSRVYVTGQLGADRPSTGIEIFYNPPHDYGTVAYDAADGSLEWVARYPGAGGYNVALDLALTASGNRVVVTGISSGPGWEDTNDRDAAVVTYDALDGRQVWESAYRAGYAYGWGVAVVSDVVYVAASSTGHSVTLAYSMSDGSTQWTSTDLPGTGEGALEHVEARGIVAAADRVFTFGVGYPVNPYEGSNARIQAFDL
jgi:WD40 repeat protein